MAQCDVRQRTHAIGVLQGKTMKSLVSRCNSNDLVEVVKSLRADPPVLTDVDKKKLKRLLGQPTVPKGLLLWVALCGPIEMKQVVAKNISASLIVLEALLMDAEAAPFYVFDILARDDIYAAFISDVFSDEPQYSDAENLEELIYKSISTDADNAWKELIPKNGSCNILQAELIRILWRFGRTLNNMIAYQLHYDDKMFCVLFSAVDSLSQASTFSKNVLKAFLRWSQIKQRGGSEAEALPSHGYERFDPVNLVVDIFLRKFKEPIPFNSIIAYGEK